MNKKVMETLSSWLLQMPGGVWPMADVCILLFPKIIYLSVQAFLWIFLGRTVKIWNVVRISPSLSLLRYSYKLREVLGFGAPASLKIGVPKYDYKVYCPINISKDDYINMTSSEEDIIQQFRPKSGDIVIDVGAHIGRYTIIASKRVSLNGKVVAIEANPDNFEMLNRNIILNRLTNVISMNYAVYSQDNRIKLYLAGEDLQTIYYTVMAERAHKGEKKFVEINANTLDHLLLLQGICEVNWIKIDVEGAELEVLKGATNILSKSQDISLLIEIHKIHNYPSDNTSLYEPISKFLKLYGFRIVFERTYKSGEKHVIARKLQ